MYAIVPYIVCDMDMDLFLQQQEIKNLTKKNTIQNRMPCDMHYYDDDDDNNIYIHRR